MSSEVSNITVSALYIVNTLGPSFIGPSHTLGPSNIGPYIVQTILYTVSPFYKWSILHFIFWILVRLYKIFCCIW